MSVIEAEVTAASAAEPYEQPVDAAEPEFLTFDQIQAADDVRTEIVSVPQWGGNVRIRALTLPELERIGRLCTDRKTKKVNEAKAKVLTVTESLVEPKLTFTQANHMLVERSGGALITLLSAVNRLNGMSEAAVADADADFRDESDT